MIDTTPRREDHRAQGWDPDFPAVAVARKLHVDRGGPHQSWEIIGFMHKHKRDVGPITLHLQPRLRSWSRRRETPMKALAEDLPLGEKSAPTNAVAAESPVDFPSRTGRGGRAHGSPA